MAAETAEDVARRSADILACIDTVTRFMAHFDAADGAAMADLYTDDGRWTRIDGVVEGRGALRDLAAGRPRGLWLRHVLSNLLVDWIDDDHAQVSSLVTVYRHGFEGDGKTPAPLEGPQAVGRYVDTLTRTAGGWKISVKTSEPIFVRKEPIK